MAAVSISLAGSSGFSEAHTCDNGRETQEVTTEYTQVLQLASVLTHFHFRFWAVLPPRELWNPRVWLNHSNEMRFLPRRGLETEVRSLPSATLGIASFLEKSPAGGQDPQIARGTSASAKPRNASDQARGGAKPAESSPRPVAEDEAARAGQRLLRRRTGTRVLDPEVSRGRFPGDPKQRRGSEIWQVPGSRVRGASVLPGRAGWCSWRSRCSPCWGSPPRCRRDWNLRPWRGRGGRGVARGAREPPPAGARAARRAARAAGSPAWWAPPGEGASAEPVLPKPPRGPGRRPPAAAQHRRCPASSAGECWQRAGEGPIKYWCSRLGSPREVSGQGLGGRRIQSPGAALLSGF